MNIEYVGRNFSLDDRIREHTEDKLAKVLKFLEEPIEVRATFEVEKHRHIVDLHIAHRMGVLQATEEAADTYDAVNSAVDKVGKQARRARKKLREKRRRPDPNGLRWPVTILEGASFGGDTEGPRIIRSTHLEIKPMSVEEAVLQLDGSKNDFVVFRDAATDRINVLYKRKDQNYGLIAPEL